MPTSNAEELGLFLKCTVIGRGVFGPCACWRGACSSTTTTSGECVRTHSGEYVATLNVMDKFIRVMISWKS